MSGMYRQHSSCRQRVVSTGGVAALAAKILRSNKSDKAKSEPAINSTERRMNDADSNF